MSLTKETFIDKIEILDSGVIQVRETTRVLENGNVLSQSFNRWTLAPGQDISDQQDKVKTIANATWTTDVVSEYQSKIQASEIAGTYRG